MGITVRRTQPSEAHQVEELYRSAGYAGTVRPEDRVWIAAEGPTWVGIVRLVNERDVTVLRGMRVLPAHQRRGIGAQLLRALIEVLDGGCYCIPYAHLVGFYAAGGFREIETHRAPPFLAERLADYRRRRPDEFTLMFRPPPVAAPPGGSGPA